MAKKNIKAQIKFYSNIGGWGITAASFANEFEHLAAQHDEVLVRVHCYGGSVMEGNVIYNTILNASAKTNFQIDGIAASMMALIVLSGSHVSMADNGFVMIHRPVSSLGGNATQLENEAKLLKSMEANFVKRIMEKTGKPKKEVEKLMDGNDHWFNADEAKGYGLIDEIIPATVKNLKQLQSPEQIGVEDVYNRFAASLNKVNNLPNNNKNTQQMKKLLIDLYKLQGVSEDSSDAEILAAMQAHTSSQEQKIKDMETAQAAALKSQIDHIINTAEANRKDKYDDKQRAVLVQIGEKAGVEALQTSLGMSAKNTPSGSGVPKIVDMLGKESKGGSDNRSDWDWEKWQKEDPRGLEKMETDNPERFNALMNAAYNL